METKTGCSRCCIQIYRNPIKWWTFRCSLFSVHFSFWEFFIRTKEKCNANFFFTFQLKQFLISFKICNGKAFVKCQSCNWQNTQNNSAANRNFLFSIKMENLMNAMCNVRAINPLDISFEQEQIERERGMRTLKSLQWTQRYNESGPTKGQVQNESDRLLLFEYEPMASLFPLT